MQENKCGDTKIIARLFIFKRKQHKKELKQFLFAIFATYNLRNTKINQKEKILINYKTFLFFLFAIHNLRFVRSYEDKPDRKKDESIVNVLIF